MTEPINPVAEAEESGLAYTNQESNPAYILLNLHRDKDEEGHLSISLDTEGVNKKQAIAILTAVLETMKADIDVLSLKAEDINL